MHICKLIQEQGQASSGTCPSSKQTQPGPQGLTRTCLRHVAPGLPQSRLFARPSLRRPLTAAYAERTRASPSQNVRARRYAESARSWIGWRRRLPARPRALLHEVRTHPPHESAHKGRPSQQRRSPPHARSLGTLTLVDVTRRNAHAYTQIHEEATLRSLPLACARGPRE